MWLFYGANTLPYWGKDRYYKWCATSALSLYARPRPIRRCFADGSSTTGAFAVHLPCHKTSAF